MAELADALDSGSSGGNFVKVQVLLPAPSTKNPNRNGSDFWYSVIFLSGAIVISSSGISRTKCRSSKARESRLCDK